jgi:hypothetical protein
LHRPSRTNVHRVGRDVGSVSVSERILQKWSFLLWRLWQSGRSGRNGKDVAFSAVTYCPEPDGHLGSPGAEGGQLSVDP